MSKYIVLSNATSSPGSGQQSISQALKAFNKTQRPFSGPLNIATFNVRTLLQTGQQALLAKSLDERNIDICAISESRLPESGCTVINVPNSKHYFKLYYSGPNNRNGLHGVAISLSSRLLPYVTAFMPVNERLAIIKLNSRPLTITIIAA